jgi:small subunit ribosomal protein S5
MAIDPNTLELREEVIGRPRRVAKVVKGGKRFHFSVLVAIGDGKGVVGVGMGKANEVPDAIQKAIEKAKKQLVRVPLRGSALSNPVVGRFGASKVVFKPAAPGSGLIAGSGVRTVLRLAGVNDCLAKCLGSTNHYNMVRATLDAFRKLNTWSEARALRKQITGAARHSNDAPPSPSAAPDTGTPAKA